MDQEKRKPKKIVKKKSEATTISEEQPIRWRVSSYLSSQPRRPRGRPPGRKKNGHQTYPLNQRRLEACIKKKVERQRSTLQDEEIRAQ